MPTFDTPRPISARFALGFVVADVRVTASERGDTEVDVRPVDESSKADVKVAEQTRVEYADGVLLVRAPKLAGLARRTGAIDVTITLPSGSDVHGETGMGEILGEGPLGDCRLKTGFGDVRLDHARTARLKSGSGDVTVGNVEGDAEITSGSGAVWVRRIDGEARIKCSNGPAWVGEVAGTLSVKGGNGPITVDRAHAGVSARTALGNIRIGEVVRDSVTLQTAAGSLEVGIRPGTAAWLDLDTTAGRVRNELDATDGPADTDEVVEIRARTPVGDIVVHHA